MQLNQCSAMSRLVMFCARWCFQDRLIEAVEKKSLAIEVQRHLEFVSASIQAEHLVRPKQRSASREHDIETSDKQLNSTTSSLSGTCSIKCSNHQSLHASLPLYRPRLNTLRPR